MMKNRRLLYGGSRTTIRSAKEASAKFSEWTTLFSGKIFVTLTVYADETGTHDPHGKLPGSEAPVFGGFMETVDEWVVFIKNWASVLDKTDAQFFMNTTHSSTVSMKPPKTGASEPGSLPCGSCVPVSSAYTVKVTKIFPEN